MSLPPSDRLEAYYPATSTSDGVLTDDSGNNRDAIYGPNARWIWFVKPRAVYDANTDTTFIGYIGGDSGGSGPLDIVVGAYDHANSTWETAVLHDAFSEDDHNNPAFTILDDGNLAAFWSGHNSGTMYYAVTSTPGDISSFGSRQSISQDSVTYPQPYTLSDGTVRLHYRERAGTGDGHQYVRESTDGGNTWNAQTRFIEAPTGHYGIYIVTVQDSVGDIHYFATDAQGPTDDPKHDVRYVKYDVNAGDWVDSTGSVIVSDSDLPMQFSDLEVVYDSGATGNDYAWVWDCGIDSNDNPGVVFATFPSRDAHDYYWGYHDGSSWTTAKVTDGGGYIDMSTDSDGGGLEGYYSSGLAMDRRDPTTIYLSIGASQGATTESTLKKYATSDGGSSWTSSIVSEKPQHNIRPTCPADAHSDIPVTWNGGSYYWQHQSQTVLDGVPGILNPTPSNGPAYNISIGPNRWDPTRFDSGLSVSARLTIDDLSRSQTHIDLEDHVELTTNAKGSADIEFTIGATTASYNGLTEGEPVFVEGKWDGSTMYLLVDGSQQSTASQSTAPSFSDDSVSTALTNWDFVKSASTATPREIRVYSTFPTDSESQSLYEASQSGFTSATLKTHDGSAFVERKSLQSYDGSTFAERRNLVYNGSEWLSFTAPSITSFTASTTADTTAPTISNFTATKQ